MSEVFEGLRWREIKKLLKDWGYRLEKYVASAPYIYNIYSDGECIGYVKVFPWAREQWSCNIYTKSKQLSDKLLFHYLPLPHPL
jgi:hypothetical protein